MRRIFTLLTPLALMLAAAMALSGVAQAASPSEMCREKAESLTGKNLADYSFVVGTENSNTFHPTEGRDEVFCGFDGGDRISYLDEGDIFIGGAGADEVGLDNEGTFYGGAGNDSVYVNWALKKEPSATFNGGAGNDSVTGFNHGTFNGGDGEDHVDTNSNYGTFNGGDGEDSVDTNYGTFNGGDGEDSVDTNFGTFNGGLSNDYVREMRDGVFDGGPGWDGIGGYLGGRTLNVDYIIATP